MRQVIRVRSKSSSLGYGFGSGSIGMSVVDVCLCCFIGVSRHKVHREFREVSSRKDSELGVNEMVAP
jgi:hypothetical protein